MAFKMSKLSRSSSPLDHQYDSYDNTRETTRLQTEYDVQVTPKPSEKKAVRSKTDRLISWIRLVLRVISFLISSSIVIVLGYSVWLYRSTKDEDVEAQGDRQGLQSVWLSNLKMKPTYVLLGVSCAATLLSLLIIIANFSKVIRRVTELSNFVTAIVSGIGVFLWLGVGAWYKSDDWNKAMNTDITSYVCRHRNYKQFEKVLGNMDLLCGALRYAWWAVLLASSVELFSMATVGWGVLVAKKRGTYAKI